MHYTLDPQLAIDVAHITVNQSTAIIWFDSIFGGQWFLEVEKGHISTTRSYRRDVVPVNNVGTIKPQPLVSKSTVLYWPLSFEIGCRYDSFPKQILIKVVSLKCVVSSNFKSLQYTCHLGVSGYPTSNTSVCWIMLTGGLWMLSFQSSNFRYFVVLWLSIERSCGAQRFFHSVSIATWQIDSIPAFSY